MLVPSPDDWKLEPLDDYVVEIEGKGRDNNSKNQPKPLMVNGPGKVVGTAALNINWHQTLRNNIKGISNAKCNCARCRGGR
jgi:hypothetical protein